MAVEIKFLVDTQEEKDKIDADAKALGLTMSHIIRLLIRDWQTGKITINLSNKPTEEEKKE